MYTYNEIKEALLSQISQLLAIEPKWNRCNKCPYSGACCIGADISVYEYEWLIIRDYLLANPDILSTVRKNFNSKSLCYFRTQDKCVIHEIRPLNCIFTPYQSNMRRRQPFALHPIHTRLFNMAYHFHSQKWI